MSRLAGATPLPQCPARPMPEMPMAALDLETEYSPRLTVPDHAEIFARWARAAEDYRAEMLTHGKAELGLCYGEIAAGVHRSLSARGGRKGAARHVHPWRLLARDGSFLPQPHGARAERAWLRRRDGRLRSLPERHPCRHRRADSARLRFSLAAVWQAHSRLRAFGRRASCGRDGRNRLARALLQKRRPISCRPAMPSQASSISPR